MKSSHLTTSFRDSGELNEAVGEVRGKYQIVVFLYHVQVTMTTKLTERCLATLYLSQVLHVFFFEIWLSIGISPFFLSKKKNLG